MLQLWDIVREVWNHYSPVCHKNLLCLVMYYHIRNTKTHACNDILFSICVLYHQRTHFYRQNHMMYSTIVIVYRVSYNTGINNQQLPVWLVSYWWMLYITTAWALSEVNPWRYVMWCVRLYVMRYVTLAVITGASNLVLCPVFKSLYLI